jgi:hypothetical protein
MAPFFEKNIDTGDICYIIDYKRLRLAFQNNSEQFRTIKKRRQIDGKPISQRIIHETGK